MEFSITFLNYYSKFVTNFLNIYMPTRKTFELIKTKQVPKNKQNETYHYPNTDAMHGVHNVIYDSRNNSNAIIETETNTLITGCTKTIIPNTVTCIQSGAFSDQVNMTSITIPNSITNIENTAF